MKMFTYPSAYKIQDTPGSYCRNTCHIAVDCLKIFYNVVRNIDDGVIWKRLERRKLFKFQHSIQKLKEINEKLSDFGNRIKKFEGLDDLYESIESTLNSTKPDFKSLQFAKKKTVFVENITPDDHCLSKNDGAGISCNATTTQAFEDEIPFPGNTLAIRNIQKKISKNKTKNKIRFYELDFSRTLTEQEADFFVSQIANLNISAQKVNDFRYNLKFIGSDKNRLTRKYGIIDTITKNFRPKVSCSLSNKIVVENQENYRFLIDEAACFFRILDSGPISYTEIKRYFFRKMKSKHGLEILTKILGKLKNKSKYSLRKQRLEVKLHNINLFDSENLFKEKLEYKNSETTIYFSNDVLDYIRNRDFDHMFIDGTHLTSLGKKQFIIVRLYSSVSKQILTSFYVLMPSKKAEAYTEVINYLNETGALKNLKFSTSDFELAIISGIENSNIQTVKHRFCFFHLISSCRKKKNSINKVIEIDNAENNRNHQKVTSHLFRLLAFSIFVPPESQMAFFNTIKFFMRIFTNSLANEMFFLYFKRTYLTGSYKKNFYLDMEVSEIITNNFVEGINSSLKRHSKGRLGIAHLLDWMHLDAKKNILGVNDNKISSHEPANNPIFKEFQRELKKNGNWLLLFKNYVMTLGKKPKTNKDLFAQNNNTFLDFFNFMSKYSFVIKKNSVRAKFGREADILITDKQYEDNLLEETYYATIEKDWQKIYRQIVYK